MSNRVVHFEIPAEQPEKLGQFYSELFGWKVQKVPVEGFDYWLCHTGEGVGIDGAIVRRSATQPGVTNSVRVDDVDAFLRKAELLGAKVVVSKTAVPGTGWYAAVTDPQGNPVGLWQGDKTAR